MDERQLLRLADGQLKTEFDQLASKIAGINVRDIKKYTASLVHTGWLEFRADASDKRKKRVFRTVKAEEAVAKGFRGRASFDIAQKLYKDEWGFTPGQPMYEDIPGVIYVNRQTRPMLAGRQLQSYQDGIMFYCHVCWERGRGIHAFQFPRWPGRLCGLGCGETLEGFADSFADEAEATPADETPDQPHDTSRAHDDDELDWYPPKHDGRTMVYGDSHGNRVYLDELRGHGAKQPRPNKITYPWLLT